DRRRRAGGSSRHQCGGHVPAPRPTEPAHLQQGESRGCADPDAGAHLSDAAAAQGPGLRRHAARANDLAPPRRWLRLAPPRTDPAVIVNIQRQPGANIINVVDRVRRLLPQLTASLPSSIEVSVLTDRTTTIRASVRDVEFELSLTVALVVLVIFLFLRNVSAT